LKKPRGFNALADQDDITAITTKTNGEFNGFAYRQRQLARAKFFLAWATTPSPGSAAGGNGNETG
jgi:hypothetical protein